MDSHMRTELVLDALHMALAQRRPAPGLVWHTDQGSQFVALAFGQQARRAGIAQSMGSRGDCFDNAVAETFFATLKKELIHRRSWPDRAELRTEVFDYIEAVLQPQAQALHARHDQPGRLRASPDRSSSTHLHHDLTNPCPPNRGNSTSRCALTTSAICSALPWGMTASMSRSEPPSARSLLVKPNSSRFLV
jgi:transposase InsO family protein